MSLPYRRKRRPRGGRRRRHRAVPSPTARGGGRIHQRVQTRAGGRPARAGRGLGSRSSHGEAGVGKSDASMPVDGTAGPIPKVGDRSPRRLRPQGHSCALGPLAARRGLGSLAAVGLFYERAVVGVIARDRRHVLVAVRGRLVHDGGTKSHGVLGVRLKTTRSVERSRRPLRQREVVLRRGSAQGGRDGLCTIGTWRENSGRRSARRENLVKRPHVRLTSKRIAAPRGPPPCPS